MKIAKFLSFLFLGFAGTAVLFSSCSLDDDEDEPEVVRHTFVTVDNPDRLEKFHIVLDNGTRFYTSEVGETYSAPPKDGLRALAGFVELDARNIRIKSVNEATIEQITEDGEELRNDEHGLLILNAGKTYLNVWLSYYTSYSDEYEHKLSLIKKEYKSDEAHFDLIYSNGGDTEGTNNFSAPICFDLSPLKEIYPDSVNLVITTYQKGAGNPVDKSLTLKWQE